MASLAYYLGTDLQTNQYPWKSSPIQKGLVPRFNGEKIDLVEEGIGFGVPILQCTRDFFFPGTAIAVPNGEIHDGVANKVFTFDLIERMQMQDEKNHVQAFSWLYTRLLNTISKTSFGRNFFQIYNQYFKPKRSLFNYQPGKFIRVPDHGLARSNYTIDATCKQINVSIDFSGISKHNLQRIYVSNELGGQLFTRYLDGSQLQLQNEQIEPWNKIDASWALFYAPRIRMGFLIDLPNGVEAFRGREAGTPELCWSGIIFSVPPRTEELNYTILIGSIQQLMAVIKKHD